MKPETARKKLQHYVDCKLKTGIESKMVTKKDLVYSIESMLSYCDHLENCLWLKENPPDLLK